MIHTAMHVNFILGVTFTDKIKSPALSHPFDAGLSIL